MKQLAFKMQLKAGYAIEYKRRHDEIWPELVKLLHNAGINDYSIFLDEETGSLFAVMRLVENPQTDQLSRDPVMRRWWAYMADIMETQDDLSPQAVPLASVFHLA